MSGTTLTNEKIAEMFPVGSRWESSAIERCQHTVLRVADGKVWWRETGDREYTVPEQFDMWTRIIDAPTELERCEQGDHPVCSECGTCGDWGKPCEACAAPLAPVDGGAQ